VPVERLVVVHDEVDLPFGTMRVKYAGGDNGHNGLKSLRQALGTGDYHRVRIGVGRPQGRGGTADHVLSEFSAQEREEIPWLCERGADAVASLMEQGLERTQAEFNG
jgi:PTH1 family peptidyl-tRNA hydrolase